MTRMRVREKIVWKSRARRKKTMEKGEMGRTTRKKNMIGNKRGIERTIYS